MLAAMTVDRVLRASRVHAAELGRPAGLGRVLALLALVALPFTDGCTDNDGGIVQDTLNGGGACGDGVVDPDEACDDEDDDPRNDCTNECQAPACGDGVASAGEACDDADDDDADACTAACALGPAAVAAVATGDYHVCAVSEASVVRCWGAPDYGRLGQPGYNDYDDAIGDDEPPSDWDAVQVADDVDDVVAGSNHSCALRAGGGVRCWGANGSGQLGYGNTDAVGDDETPADAGDVPLPGPVASLAAGSVHTCAVLESGDVVCWGSNYSGQLGLGTTDNIGDDELVDGATGIVPLPGPAVEVAAGLEHTCARLESGDVVCWGRQTEGQLGTGAPDSIGDDESVGSLGPIDLGGKAIDIDTSDNHVCAVLDDGAVRCWGYNGSGQLGNGDEALNNVGDRKTPAESSVVMLEELAIQVETGTSHTCAVLVNGNVRCWGTDTANGVPDTYGSSVVPYAAARIGAPVQRLSAGYGFNCAVLDSAGVRCWGSNEGFVLGNPMAEGTVKDATVLEDVDVF
jgi:alpha-tubulin suppressor-like RCC1 family protein